MGRESLKPMKRATSIALGVVRLFAVLAVASTGSALAYCQPGANYNACRSWEIQRERGMRLYQQQMREVRELQRFEQQFRRDEHEMQLYRRQYR